MTVVGQVWESRDPRDVTDGQLRRVRIVSEGVDTVRVENTVTGRITNVKVTNLTKLFRLVDGGEQ